ncbi:MAG: glycosyltransferase family 1 protein [Armatimonadota bacterium]|jgi:glycosyltransferase involved in cell wall biosynthesis
MRIGIDARTVLGRKTGDRSYTLGLIHGLASVGAGHEFVLYVDRDPGDALQPPGPSFAVRTVTRPGGRLWTLLALPAAARRDGLDVLHVQYMLPFRAPCPVVTTIHDVSFRLHPEWFTLRDRLVFALGLPGSLRRAAAIMAVSECTRADLVREYGVPLDKVHVTPNALPPDFTPPADPDLERVRARYALPDPYALFLGVLQPRKNPVRTIRGFVRAKREANLPHLLAMVGKRGWLHGDVLPTVRELEAEADVLFPGYAADEDLPALYAAADLFLFPTLYEGFGIPVLEAFACGTPTIASGTSGTAETAGDAALLVDPYSEDEIAEAIVRALTDEELRGELRRKGLRRARDFSWERTAELTIACYESVARP